MADEQSQLELLRICLRQQIDEMEMLQSIFVNEFEMSDFSVEADFNAFLDNDGPPPDTQLQFTIRLDLSPSTRLDIRVQLPHLYPMLEVATISVLSSDFSNGALQNIRHALNRYLESLVGADVYVYQAYQWVQDNAAKYRSTTAALNPSTSPVDEAVKPIEMERIWIYSHHIKSKTKRQDMVNLGKQLSLSGFHRPGRPGIICAEGRKVNVQEFWRTVRQWNWQKIGVRRSDTATVVGDEAEKEFRRFNGAYHEKVFTTGDDIGEDLLVETGGEREAMDMGVFMKFLEHHRCGDVKRDLFGFE